MKDILKKRTKTFAHNCVRATAGFTSNYLGNHITMQLIRCATSVAANYRTACLAQSKASFVAKLSFVIEEVDEFYFWLEFAIDEKVSKGLNPLLQEAQELTAIFIASRKTASQH